MYCSGMIGVNGAITWRSMSVLRLAFARLIAVSKAFAEAFEKSEANRIRRMRVIIDPPLVVSDEAGGPHDAPLPPLNRRDSIRDEPAGLGAHLIVFRAFAVRPDTATGAFPLRSAAGS